MADEYIKRDTAYNFLTEYYNHRTDNQHQNLRKALNAIPSEDVVEVVRCKDCKYAHMTYDGKCKYCDTWNGEEDPLYLDGDFYCGFGERKDSGT